MNLHSSIKAKIYNSQKVETTQVSINWWIDIQTISYHIILWLIASLSYTSPFTTTRLWSMNGNQTFNCKKEWSTNAHLDEHIDGWIKVENIMPSERRESQKATYCMVPSIWNVQNRKIHRNQKQISSCPGVKGRMGTGFLFQVVKMFWN